MCVPCAFCAFLTIPRAKSPENLSSFPQIEVVHAYRLLGPENWSPDRAAKSLNHGYLPSLAPGHTPGDAVDRANPETVGQENQCLIDPFPRAGNPKIIRRHQAVRRICIPAKKNRIRRPPLTANAFRSRPRVSPKTSKIRSGSQTGPGPFCTAS